MIDKDTILCMSIAGSPGNFGAKFHNYFYEQFGLNYVYLPRKVLHSELEEVISAIRVMKVRGCGVSMPYKEEIIKYLDEMDQSAVDTGAVNTIVNDDSKLKGYNTDYYGAEVALHDKNISGKKILLFGAGGVAMAISSAVQKLGGYLSIFNRTHSNAYKLAAKTGAEPVLLEDLVHQQGYMLINATPVGMDSAESPFSEDLINKFDYVYDVVVSPPKTRLLCCAEQLGKRIIPGALMCIHQAAKQFELYTGIEIPAQMISNKLKEMYPYDL
ncbi:MAG: shikimate dehydrogenase [Nanoarchaeota archaeon]